MSLIRPMFVFAAVLALGLLVGCSSTGPSSSGKVGGSSSGSPSDGSSKGVPSSSAITLADCPAAVVVANTANDYTQVKLADIPELTKASIDLEPSCAFKAVSNVDGRVSFLAFYVTKQATDVADYYKAAYTTIGVSSQEPGNPTGGVWVLGAESVAMQLGDADTNPEDYPLFAGPFLWLSIG